LKVRTDGWNKLNLRCQLDVYIVMLDARMNLIPPLEKTIEEEEGEESDDEDPRSA
jgi:hypothetical protein